MIDEDTTMYGLMIQRQRHAWVQVRAADGEVQMRPTAGNFMGNRFVPGAFALTAAQVQCRQAGERQRSQKTSETSPMDRKRPDPCGHFHGNVR